MVFEVMASPLNQRQSAETDESTLRQTVYSVERNAEKSVETEFTLDSILDRIGHFGRFQAIVFVLICMPMTFNAIDSVTYVFTASTVVHRM